MLVVSLLLLTLYQIANVESFNLKPMHVIARRDQLTFEDKELIGFFVCYDKCEKNSSCSTFSYFAPNGRCAEADYSKPRKVGEIRGKRNDNGTCDLTTAKSTSATSQSTSIDTSSTSEITPTKTTTKDSPTSQETTLRPEDTSTVLTPTTSFEISTTVDITTTTTERSSSPGTTLEITESSTSIDPTSSTSEQITEQSTTAEQSTSTESTLSTTDADTTTIESSSASTTTKKEHRDRPSNDALIEIRTWHNPKVGTGPELICNRELPNCNNFIKNYKDGILDSYNNGFAIRLDRLDVINTTSSCDALALRMLCFKKLGTGFKAYLFDIKNKPTDWCLGIVATEKNTCGAFWNVDEIKLADDAYKYKRTGGKSKFWLFKRE